MKRVLENLFGPGLPCGPEPPNPPGNGDVGPQTLLRRASSSRLFSSLIILSVCCPCIVEISFKDSCRRQMSSLEAKASCDSILRISDTRTSSQVKATDAAKSAES